MECNKCSINICSCLHLIISIIFGAVVGVLFAFNNIPSIVPVIWIALGLGGVSLIALISGLFLAATGRPGPLSKCLCRHTECLLAGIIGTILAATAAIATMLTPAYISVIILVSITAFFFSLLIIGLIGFISCIACRLCSSRNEEQ